MTETIQPRQRFKFIDVARAIPLLRTFLSPIVQLTLEKEGLLLKRQRVEELKKRAIIIDRSDPEKAIVLMGEALKKEEKLETDEMINRVSIHYITNPPGEIVEKKKEVLDVTPKKRVLSNSERIYLEKQQKIHKELKHYDRAAVIEKILNEEKNTPEKEKQKS